MNLVKRSILIVFVIFVVFMLGACNEKKNNILQVETTQNNVEETEALELICVYVVGEVNVPGVYELPKDSRVCDAIQAAGGFTEQADQEYINLAGKILDGEKIMVYSVSQVENNEIVVESSSALININTADAEKLMLLPGIGESRAKDIINYREQNGKFETIEDIMNVSGIKEAAFSKIKDMITVN